MQAFFRDGSVRIGTLYDWRKSNRYGEMVCDGSEGILAYDGNLIFYDPRYRSALKVDSQVTMIYGREGPIRQIRHTHIESLDAFTFCAASTYSEQDHEDWRRHEGYDACYRINDPDGFFKAISKAFRKKAQFAMWRKVYYYAGDAGNTIVDGAFHPALLKRQEYGSQDEIRAIWIPKGHKNAISPLTLLVPDAVRFCERFKVL